MPNIDYSENLFRSIDTIVAERIKNLPYDTTQLVEIIDDTNANTGMYKVTSNHQLEEIAYADNPTYEKGDKVYVLNTADNSRRFILGLYQRSDIGRTDRMMSILDGSLISLKDLLEKQIQDGLEGLNKKIDGLDIYFGLTADGILSIVAAKEEGLATMIRQTADEIRMEAENTYEGLNSSFSITASQIRSEVHDLTAGLESSITQTAGQIRSEVHDYYNELESSITQTAGQIRSEVHDYQNGLESSITQTADKIEANVVDLKNEMETLISQTAYEIRSEAYDIQNGLQSEFSQTAEEINFKVEDINQGLSIVSQTAAEIDSKVIDLEGNVSDISQTATAITQRVTNMEGDFSLLEQTADHISSRVEAVEGNYSEIRQTADQISSKVEGIEGGYSEIKQTESEISSRIEDLKGNYSEIVQNVNSITSRVEDVNNGLNSKIEQTAGSITTLTEDLHGNYSTTTQTSKEITNKVQAVDNKYASTKLTLDGWSVTTDSGTTEINGAKIKTGTITADKINAASFDVIHKDAQNKTVGRLGMYIGSASQSDDSGNIISITPTYGAAIYGKNESYVVTATEAGARMSDTKTKIWNNKVYSDPDVAIYVSGDSAVMYSYGNQVKVSNKGITSSDSVHTISDRKMKHTISYDLSSYEIFYNKLQPASYIYNSDLKNKKHIGFIYQDIETSLLHSGLTSLDFAGVYKAHNDDGSIWCGLGYTEFIALNTYMIQKTRKELEEKDNKIQQLENKIDELEQKLNLLLETLS